MSEQSFTPAPPPSNKPVGTSGKQMALASMISGIVGLTIVPLIGSILGLVFANIAKKDPNLDSTDNSYVKIGVITSWVGLVITIAIIIFAVLLAIVGITVWANI